MKLLLQGLALLLLGSFVFAQAQRSKQATPGTQQPAPAAQKNKAPKRVRAKLDGFDLAPRPTSGSGTQIGGATRGLGTATTLLAPNRGQSYTLHPLFQWSNSNPNIKSYRFQLIDADGQAVYEARVTGTNLVYPADAPALKPGTTYSWTVQPLMGLLGGPAEPAQMVILGGPERARIESALAQVSGNGEQQRLAAAQLFVDRRLWYDAVKIYTDLIAAHPEDAALYEQRAIIYDQLPQTQVAAQEDLSRAEKLQK